MCLDRDRKGSSDVKEDRLPFQNMRGDFVMPSFPGDHLLRMDEFKYDFCDLGRSVT